MEDIRLCEGETVTEVNDNISLIQNPKGLTFGTDALLLAGYIRRSPKAAAAELGAGSGIISLLLATRKKLKKIDAFEVQPDYFSICKRNVELNGLCDSVFPVLKDVRDMNARDIGCEYDLVFSNPPYMKTESGRPNGDGGKNIARHEVLGDIRDFVAAAARMLRFGGSFYCVYRPDRMIDLLSSMREFKIEPKRMTFVLQTPFHRPSLLLVEGMKGAGVQLTLTKPLIIESEGGKMSDDMKYIYENGDFNDGYGK